MQFFPLLTLPHLALDQILRSMEIKDLVLLASISPVLKKYVPLLRIPSGGYRIHLGCLNSKVETPGHTFYTYSRPSIGPCDSMVQVSDYVNDMKDLFTGNVEYFNVCPSLLWFNIEETTDILAIGNAKYEYSNWMVDQFEDVVEENLNALLDNVDFKKGLVISGPKEIRTEHKKVFNVDWLRISHTEWITMEILNKMENKVIFLDDVGFTAQQINDFLRDLKHGRGNQNLQVITFTQRWNDEEMFTILEDLDIVENQKEQIYKFSKEDSKFDMSDFLLFGSSEGVPFWNSFDLTRIDGVRCSIVFDTDAVSVYVWNQQKESKKRSNDNGEGPSTKIIRV